MKNIKPHFVIPVKTGIQIAAFLDTRLRGYDRH